MAKDTDVDAVLEGLDHLQAVQEQHSEVLHHLERRPVVDLQGLARRLEEVADAVERLTPPPPPVLAAAVGLAAGAAAHWAAGGLVQLLADGALVAGEPAPAGLLARDDTPAERTLLMFRWRPEQTTRWSTTRQLRKAGLFAPDGLILGRRGRRLLRHDGPEHVLVVASTQSGKTSNFVYPNLLTWRESVLVHDAKDELYPETAGWRVDLFPGGAAQADQQYLGVLQPARCRRHRRGPDDPPDRAHCRGLDGPGRGRGGPHEWHQ